MSFWDGEDTEWTLEDARKMVAQTNGYYTRDYSLNLGWNNVSPPGLHDPERDTDIDMASKGSVYN